MPYKNMQGWSHPLLMHLRLRWLASTSRLGISFSRKGILSHMTVTPKYQRILQNIEKPGEFTSDNQRPITCVNTFYKWTTLCLLGPANELLETHGVIKVCTLFEQIQGLFKDSIQCKKEPWVYVLEQFYPKGFSVFAPFYLEFYLNCKLSMEMMILHRFPVWLSRTVEKLSKSWNTKGGGDYKARVQDIWAIQVSGF